MSDCSKTQNHIRLADLGKFAPNGLAYTDRDGYIPLTVKGVRQSRKSDAVLGTHDTPEEARKIAAQNRKAVRAAIKELEAWRAQYAR